MWYLHKQRRQRPGVWEKIEVNVTIDVINVFYVFYSIRVFYVFNVFFLFFFRVFYLKNSKAKYEYAKIQRETLLEDTSAMIFIDFGLLRTQNVLLTAFYWWTLR